MEYNESIKTYNRIYEFKEYYFDEVDIKSFEYNKKTETFTYPCPCGDVFEIYLEDLKNGEDVARCPSCSLIIKVVYEEHDINML